MNDTRFCRICWNTQRWQKPTGDAAKLEAKGSFVADHGFGHEEWLFNLGWMIGDCRYGFLQPFGKLNSAHSNVIDVILYTIDFNKDRLFVGRIKQCKLLTPDEATKAYRVYRRKGWLEEMVTDLKRLKANPAPIKNSKNPLSVTNVCFKLQNMEILEQYIPAPRNHAIHRIKRYTPSHVDNLQEWDDILKLQASSVAPFSFISGKLKKTERRQRAAQKGTSFDPAHDRLQNSLFEYLQEKYGHVGYERNGVDLAVQEEEKVTFYEIKMEASVRLCVRLALGQLLEYAHWPAQNKAHKLIVIGKVLPREDDKRYLSFLRKQYSLSLYYQYYDSATNTLSQEY